MVKRSRVGTASNLENTGVANYRTFPWQYCAPAPAPVPTNGLSPLVVQQSSGFEGAPLGRVLSLSSPDNRDVGRLRTGFLEQCYYCKRRIFLDEEVFMYSEHAFCTPLCRELQIVQDMQKELRQGKRKLVD